MGISCGPHSFHSVSWNSSVRTHCLPFPICSFISAWTHGYSFMHYITIQYYHYPFLLIRVQLWTLGALSGWPRRTCGLLPHFLLSTLVLSGIIRGHQAQLTFDLLWPWKQPLLQGALISFFLFFFLEMVFRNQYLSILVSGDFFSKYCCHTM